MNRIEKFKTKTEIKLVCLQCNSRNYVVYTNQNSSQENVKVKKHCKICNRHIEHVLSK